MLRAAAAAALWLLAALSAGAEDAPEVPGPCGDCFYRRTPPAGGHQPPPRPLCHSLPGGRAFATVPAPTCDTAAYSAYRLGPGRAEGGGGEEGEPATEDGGGADVLVPALLRGGAGPPGSPSDPPLRRWDAAAAALLQSAIGDQCGDLGGELYVLTGRGRPWGGGCEAEPLWSAACCAVPGGRPDFGVGFVAEAAGGGRRASLRELEEALGAEELFSEGCGGAAEVTGEEGQAAAATEEEGEGEGEGEGEDEAAGGGGERRDPEDAATSESGEQQGETRAGGPSPGGEAEVEPEPEPEDRPGGLLLSVVSAAASVVTAPLRPAVSAVAQLPGQVAYVLQEDLGVLAALPGDAFSLVRLLTSDLFSWMGAGADTLLGVGRTGLSSVSHCGRGMLGALLDSCYAGVAGTGALAGDAVGIFGSGLENCWWVTRFFGGRVWEQSEGYVGSVVSEMGGQAKAVGGGLGRLVWRSGNGVGNIFRAGGGLMWGVVEGAVGLAQEAFGQEES